ncbi:glycosyltransferase family 2 protein [Hymenobacter mucosus]|uniref:Glycosyltransferase involved in cell wall bisynthesis n=1 Tax=Hymenobacter mucosus TaxID=1411120 RepID=A0A238YH71_9BACT|nr:glycosyltransferase [Hymenobacter mucosus]SNR69963.1 Glycosyltransferase involved in cell wall bisynthesis [Hymenobacter mucosus]
MPKVTVIVPNYNHARYLPLRIESVLQQTEQDIEVLLLDDCSPDNSREILEQYAAKDSRITLVYNEQNSGSTFHQWNKGLSLAKGEYIWIAESDDYAEPNFLETLLRPLQQDSAIGLVYCESQTVDEDNRELGIHHIMPKELEGALLNQNFVVHGIDLIKQFMSFCNIVPNASGAVMRRSVLKQAGPADANYRLVGDWIFWAKIMAISKVAFISTPLNYFRQHTNNVRSNTLRSGLALVEEARVMQAIKAFGEPNKANYEKKINNILGKWFYAFVANHEMPWSLHRQLYRELCALEPTFPRRFTKYFFSTMIENKFSGLRQLIGDGLLKRIVSK